MLLKWWVYCWTITVEGDNNAKNINKKLTFNNNALFRSFILKIYNTFIDNAEDHDFAIPIYDLLEHSNKKNKIQVNLLNKRQN